MRHLSPDAHNEIFDLARKLEASKDVPREVKGAARIMRLASRALWNYEWLRQSGETDSVVATMYLGEIAEFRIATGALVEGKHASLVKKLRNGEDHGIIFSQKEKED